MGTPSPRNGSKHLKSPWTADRLRKKTKMSPPSKLPGVAEERAIEEQSCTTGVASSLLRNIHTYGRQLYSFTVTVMHY